MIHFVKPYSPERNLGKVYNYAFTSHSKNDWVCLLDMDTMFLTPDCGAILKAYTELYPEAGIITAYTNRISLASKDQLWEGKLHGSTDISHWMRIAERIKENRTALEIRKPISGFMMCIKKAVWENHKFRESGPMLGLDNEFSQSILNSGLKIYRANGLFVFHCYRLLTGIHQKSHLAI